MIPKYFQFLLAIAPASCAAASSSSDDSRRADWNIVRNSTGTEHRQENERANMHNKKDTGRIRHGETDAFNFVSETRISIDVQFDPDIGATLKMGKGSERSYVNRVFKPCALALQAAGRSISIRGRPGQIPDNGTNIIVRLTIGPNARGTPYRVSLFASQGRARWSASIERPFIRGVPGNTPIRPDRTTGDGRPYWDAAWDTDALAQNLCDHLLRGGSNASER